MRVAGVDGRGHQDRLLPRRGGLPLSGVYQPRILSKIHDEPAGAGLSVSVSIGLLPDTSKRGQKSRFLPITLWTDLDNKQPPFVEVTEGGIFMGHNCSINWGLSVPFIC